MVLDPCLRKKATNTSAESRLKARKLAKCYWIRNEMKNQN